ncbi:hypothetical protein ACET3Z_007795 [Daucus carota]
MCKFWASDDPLDSFNKYSSLILNLFKSRQIRSGLVRISSAEAKCNITLTVPFFLFQVERDRYVSKSKDI